MNKKRTFVIAASLAILTTLIGYFYISNIKKEAVEEAEIDRVQVVTVTSQVPAHVELTEEMLEMKEFPEEVMPSSAITTFEEAVGMKTKSELIPGEPLLSERLVTDETSTELSYRIPEEMRAITIPSNEITGVAGYIVAGDYVDMLVAYTEEDDEEDEEGAGQRKIEIYTQMQNLEVLMTGPYQAQPEVEPEVSIPSSLTFLVSPEQAEVIAFANQTGSIQLTLRNPADSELQDLDGYGDSNFDNWEER